MKEEITLDLYQKYGVIYKDEKKALEDALQKSGKRVSNLEKCLDVAFEMAGNLHRMWELLPYKDKSILQKVLFPEGIRYSKKTNKCRTTEVNYVFGYFAQLARDVAKIKSGESKLIFDFPALVGTIGFEPMTPCL